MTTTKGPSTPPASSSTRLTQKVAGQQNSAFQIGSIGSIGGSLAFQPSSPRDANASGQDATTATPSVHDEKVRILFLGSNPSESVRLRLDTEVREIEMVLSQATFGDRFELHQKWAVRASDLQGHLLRHRPHVLHFSGHGSENNAIFLEGTDGRPHAVDASFLARLLGKFAVDLRCVVLNACFSAGQAKAIAETVDAVIGMSVSVSDVAAIRFAANFYQALAFGESIQSAFDLARSDVEIGELGEDTTPQLLCQNGKPEEMTLVTGRVL